MRILYTSIICLYEILIRIASLFQPKARQWVKGRKKNFINYAHAPAPGEKVIWFHSASLGEFEQGRPVIETWKARHPEYFILLSFFSPSGYEVRKNFPLADQVVYLPIDRPAKVRDFLNTFKPAFAVFIKYEYWYNYISELKKRNIPIYVISAIFRPGQHFFKSWGGWFRNHLQSVTHFFVQEPASAGLLKSIGINQVTISGDTRYDRVSSIAEEVSDIPEIISFKASMPLIIAGSTWPADEKMLMELNCKLVIAPHEIDAGRIERLAIQKGKRPVRYSRYQYLKQGDYDVLIIDNIGMLSSLYRYADIMYIGGGFGRGIHNILEAAAFGGPVIFGPKYQKFQEAVDLIAMKGAFSIKSVSELEELIKFYLNNSKAREEKALLCRKFVKDKQGACRKIISTIEDHLE